MHDRSRDYMLRAVCPARAGIVAAITAALAEHDCYIGEMAQFDDEDTRRFFMRAVFRPQQSHENFLPEIHAVLAPVGQAFDMDWEVRDRSVAPKVIIMVSKFDHCLADLLYRYQRRELFMEIAAVVSNHLDLRPMVERDGLRFVNLPVTTDTKPAQEARLYELIEETGTELLVLARYMQILSDELCAKLTGRAINIHHSFLPGFKGARPYHQAHARGVKLIGATAHYVSAELDEGPIIEQEIQRVDHTMSPEQMATIGRDTETIALARAVRYHLEGRVFLDGNKTVVFR